MFRTDYCGYNVHNPSKDIIYRPEGRTDYLFLHITSDMDFYFPREKGDTDYVYKYGTELTKKRAKKGDCILYTPGFLQYYQAVTTFSNSFVRFCIALSKTSAVFIFSTAVSTLFSYSFASVSFFEK